MCRHRVIALIPPFRFMNYDSILVTLYPISATEKHMCLPTGTHVYADAVSTAKQAGIFIGLLLPSALARCVGLVPKLSGIVS